MRDTLRQFLADQIGRGQPLADDTPIFSQGLLDSFVMIELITFIESEVGVRISPMEVTLDNLDTIERIVVFVESKRDAA